MNYKSFIDSKVISFSTGFNVIVGQNNVGKTALLEALGLQFTANPHKSLLVRPKLAIPFNPESEVNVSVIISGDELRNILFNDVLRFAYPVRDEHKVDSSQAKIYKERLEAIFKEPEVSVGIYLSSNNPSSPALLQLTRSPIDGQSYGVKAQPSLVNWFARPDIKEEGILVDFFVTQDKKDFVFNRSYEGYFQQELGLPVAELLRRRIYSFKAERLNVSRSPVGNNSFLSPDARNLPEVLNILKSKNPRRFDHLNELLNRVFPSIYEISIVPIENNYLEIMVWTEDPKSEREDLAISLSESGTGIGQVLAILYVVLTSEFPRVILIDEPNSFLHPSAARNVIEILRNEFPQHQYIVSTHSPEIIKASNPNSVNLIRWERPQSIVEAMDLHQIQDIQKCLREVGAKLSDVFGADAILWVEGPTEEECFPRLLLRLNKTPPVGISIVGVKNTGDLLGKRKAVFLDVYQKLSRSNALMPPAIGFIFDSEDLNQTEKDDLSRTSDHRIHFLPRRSYENYLLDPKAIASVMSTLPSFRAKPLSDKEVEQWLVENGGDKQYLFTPQAIINIQDPKWLKTVHGAKLLSDLFDAFSSHAEFYHKTDHSIKITEWLIAHNPQSLVELVDFLVEVLKATKNL